MPWLTISMSQSTSAPFASAASPGLDRAGTEVQILDDVGIAGGVNQPHRHLLLVGVEAGQVGDLANLHERLAFDFIRDRGDSRSGAWRLQFLPSLGEKGRG
jgi:hypothetical protein